MSAIEHLGEILRGFPEWNAATAAFRRKLFELSFGPEVPEKEKAQLRSSLCRDFQLQLPFLQHFVELNRNGQESEVLHLFPRRWPRKRFAEFCWGPGGMVQTGVKLYNLLESTAADEREIPSLDRLHRIAALSRQLSAEVQRLDRFLREEGRNPLELKILGYGEISTVMKPVARFAPLPASELTASQWVYKRMPIFPSQEAAQHYQRIYREYRRLLTEECGLCVPEQEVRYLVLKDGRVSLYALQKQLPAEGICHVLLHRLTEEQAVALFSRILDQYEKVWRFNDRSSNLKIALDGQISNWAVDPSQPPGADFLGAARICYLDTSTPLYRVDGQEQLDPEVFLKNSPSFLRWIIRQFFLQDVLDRYYDLRAVTVDAIANLFKEGLPGLVPRFIEVANARIESDWKSWRLEPITEKEVRSYYREDAFIWRFFQASRRIDRFVTEKIRRKRYEFRLPGKIKR